VLRWINIAVLLLVGQTAFGWTDAVWPARNKNPRAVYEGVVSNCTHATKLWDAATTTTYTNPTYKVVWQIDTYNAIRERRYAVGRMQGDCADFQYSTNANLYRDEYQNYMAFKAEIATMYCSFVVSYYASNGTLDDYFQNNPTNFAVRTNAANTSCAPAEVVYNDYDDETWLNNTNILQMVADTYGIAGWLTNALPRAMSDSGYWDSMKAILGTMKWTLQQKPSYYHQSCYWPFTDAESVVGRDHHYTYHSYAFSGDWGTSCTNWDATVDTYASVGVPGIIMDTEKTYGNSVGSASWEITYCDETTASGSASKSEEWYETANRAMPPGSAYTNDYKTISVTLYLSNIASDIQYDVDVYNKIGIEAVVWLEDARHIDNSAYSPWNMCLWTFDAPTTESDDVVCTAQEATVDRFFKKVGGVVGMVTGVTGNVVWNPPTITERQTSRISNNHIASSSSEEECEGGGTHTGSAESDVRDGESTLGEYATYEMVYVIKWDMEYE